MTNLKSTEQYFHFAEGNNLISIAKHDVSYDITMAFTKAISRLNRIKGRFRSGGDR